MLPSKRFWIQSFFAGLLALTATAQNAPADRDPTRPLTLSAIDPQTYVIRPNDILLITVRPLHAKLIKRGWPSDMTRLVRVDGQIVLPTIGPVKVEGLTLVQLRTRLAEALSIEETDMVVDRRTMPPTPPPVRRR
jgi:protein involved in polysaccharide export with SLBB domain